MLHLEYEVIKIKIKNYYLIDYENVHSDDLVRYDELSENDCVIIFFTKNAKKLDMSKISNHGKADFKWKEVPAGKQSADMHIVSYLGYLVGKYGKGCNIFIVSGDDDFNNVIKFWEKEEIKPSRILQIKKKKTKHSEARQTPSTTKRDSRKRQKKTKPNQKAYDVDMYSDAHNALSERNTSSVVDKPILLEYAEDNTSSKTLPVKVKDKIDIKSKILDTLRTEGFPNESLYVAITAEKNLGKKNGEQQTYDAIISKYGQNKGLEICNHVKNCIKESHQEQ